MRCTPKESTISMNVSVLANLKGRQGIKMGTKYNGEYEYSVLYVYKCYISISEGCSVWLC